MHKDFCLLIKSVTIQKELKNTSNRDQSKEIQKCRPPVMLFLANSGPRWPKTSCYDGSLFRSTKDGIPLCLTKIFQSHLGVNEIQMSHNFFSPVAPVAKKQCKATAFSSSLISPTVQKEADLFLSNTFQTKTSLLYDSLY